MIQVNVTLTETIKVLLDEKKYSTLRDILTTMKPFDIAAVFEELQDEKTPILFRILPKELAAETRRSSLSTASAITSSRRSLTSCLSTTRST